MRKYASTRLISSSLFSMAVTNCRSQGPLIHGLGPRSFSSPATCWSDRPSFCSCVILGKCTWTHNRSQNPKWSSPVGITIPRTGIRVATRTTAGAQRTVADPLTRNVRRLIMENPFSCQIGRILLSESHLAGVGRLARASAQLLMHVTYIKAATSGSSIEPVWEE